ncbi:beta-1,3-galactosyltransferase 2-like [Dendropsophus ebraccatus]|uniref:beta-1,3-galactosyltransferase 2-like n=1 Tax=Dendropsophus ebraccatus TaxID=150705 RepID=UPI00383124D1
MTCILKVSNMIRFKKSRCPKLTVKLQFFFSLTLLILVLLILSHSVGFLVRHVGNLHLISTFSWKFGSHTIKASRSYKSPYQYDYIINEPDKCKERVPFLVLLIMVEGRQHEERDAIRNTWGNEDLLPGVNILRLFFLGREANVNVEARQAILRESQEFHDIIQQDFMDTYKNLTIKVLSAMNWMTTYCPHALYVMKTDTDVFVNIEYLVTNLLKPDQEPKRNYITGFLMLENLPERNPTSKWYVPPDIYPYEKYPPFCSGTGYVLSGDLAHKIVEISPSVRWIYLEDVFIGFCLQKLGIQPTAPPKITDFNVWYIGFSGCEYHNIVTAHNLGPWILQDYWDRLQKSKQVCT